VSVQELSAERVDNRVAFAAELAELARADDRIVAVCNDSVGSSNLGAFRDEFPDRLFNVGIAEQNMVGVGAGLAIAGYIPFVCAAAPFLTGRALEQVKADVAYGQTPVVLCGMSPGMAYGELGPTHHSPEDFSWLRPLAGLDIVVPADAAQTRSVLRELVATPRPAYVRIGRHKVPAVSDPAAGVVRGRFAVAREGGDVTLIAAGTEVSEALAAAALLADRGVEARVLNAVYLSPLDTEAIERAAAETRGIVTAEEANVAGGLGAAVASVVAGLPRAQRVPVSMAGLREFAPTGSTSYLLEHFGLDAAALAARAMEVLDRD
jgi:transketolase